MNKCMKLMGFGLTLALAGGFAAAADAKDARAVVAQVTVRYGDLSLEQAEEATRLYRRIETAAVRVCGLKGEQDLARMQRRKACVQDAIAHAVADVAAPTLTRHYEAAMAKRRPAQVFARKD